jgi:hypothetical protein
MQEGHASICAVCPQHTGYTHAYATADSCDSQSHGCVERQQSYSYLNEKLQHNTNILPSFPHRLPPGYPGRASEIASRTGTVRSSSCDCCFGRWLMADTRQVNWLLHQIEATHKLFNRSSPKSGFLGWCSASDWGSSMRVMALIEVSGSAGMRNARFGSAHLW